MRPLMVWGNRLALAVGGAITLLVAAASQGAEAPAADALESRRVFGRLLEPREHPDYQRRAVKPPSWGTFGDRTRFTSLRGFNVVSNEVVGYREEIDKYTRQHQLGEVLWPSYPILFATNLAALADEVRARNLFLFDVWGYVPGSGPGGYWQQFRPPPAAFTVLEQRLGDRWLGTDIGEQDGRYVGGYAGQMTPASANRFEQYLNFQRHFERMGEDLGNKHATLVSLNFGHYLLKEGTCTLIGAETAQGLPNSQVCYAFIRGAGKQYGVPWFGNVSIYNRWGFKTYGSAGSGDGYQHGPTKGTSLSLMKRLLYSHILYNCVVVGFENGWFEGERLSPIGRIQQAAQRWVNEHGQPGVLQTPVALLLDFYAGWSFPRHLYTDQLYRVWGNLPYGPGDHLTDGVLGLLYPGYQDSSYWHDEAGFLAPTPYGDSTDCLLSDAPGWLLGRYPLILAAGELAAGRELRDKLEAYVASGGHLVISAGNLAKWPAGLGGVALVAHVPPRRVAPVVALGAAPASPEPAFELYSLSFPPSAQCVRTTDTNLPPLIVRARHGQGRITVLGGAFGLPAQPATGLVVSKTDQHLPNPYPLLPHVRAELEALCRQQRLFSVDPRLSLVTCRRGPGDYTLGVANNSWAELPLAIESHCGTLESCQELPLDQSEKGAVGEVPEGVTAAQLGHDSPGAIAGGSVRLFAVRVRETGIEEIQHQAPPARPQGRLLPLRSGHSLKEELLARPTFFAHFDGVAVDWRYLHERETAALRSGAGWLGRQGLRVVVDLSSGLNLFPTLRLLNNLPEDYAASRTTLADVLAKMAVLGARDLLLSLHRHPENNFTDEESRAAFAQTLRELAAEAAQRQVTLHLRLALGKPPWNLAETRALLERVGAPNLRLAPSTALLAEGNAPAQLEALRAVTERIGLWLVSAPRRDLAGRLWDAHGSLDGSDQGEAIGRCLAVAPKAPCLLDAVYESQDDEYADALALERLLRAQR